MQFIQKNILKWNKGKEREIEYTGPEQAITFYNVNKLPWKLLIYKQQKLGFFSLILQIDLASIYIDVTGHEKNWISLYLSNPHYNRAVIITGSCRKFSCTLLYLHETPYMGKKATRWGAVRTAICSFPWQAGKYSWHLLYPRMSEWLKPLIPSDLHVSLLFHCL